MNRVKEHGGIEEAEAAQLALGELTSEPGDEPVEAAQRLTLEQALKQTSEKNLKVPSSPTKKSALSSKDQKKSIRMQSTTE